jgi:hypothetical protein
MARWEEALDKLLELYLFSTSERGKGYIDGWAASVEDKQVMPGVTARLRERIITTAQAAEPIHVDPDLHTLWEAAAESFEPEPLHAQDLITPAGFVYLPRPYLSTDLHGRQTSMRAFAWSESDIVHHWGEPGDDGQTTDKTYRMRGISLLMFHQVGDLDDYDSGDRPNPRTPDYLAHSDLGLDHSMADIKSWAQVGLRRGDLIIDHVYPWAYGMDATGKVRVKQIDDDQFVWDEAGESSVTAPIRPATTPKGDIRRPVQTMFRLMQQTITTRSTAHAGGQFRRRWEREKLEPKAVTVVRLRRPKAPTAEGQGREVEWTHRWLVRGHWRNAWYASINAHRQVWVGAHTKGPEGKPLVITNRRVFELVR